MFLLKIKYKFKQFLRKIDQLNPSYHINISWEVVVLTIAIGFISTLLLSNIYSSIQDIEKYKILYEEKKKLKALEKDNYELSKKKEFYKSKYYQRLYSREALSMAEPKQDIYFIERRNQYNYNEMLEIKERIDVSDFKKWWTKLIL